MPANILTALRVRSVSCFGGAQARTARSSPELELSCCDETLVIQQTDAFTKTEIIDIFTECIVGGTATEKLTRPGKIVRLGNSVLR
jgi:hypothetical protein